jgi:hypothetical protein
VGLSGRSNYHAIRRHALRKLHSSDALASEVRRLNYYANQVAAVPDRIVNIGQIPAGQFARFRMGRREYPGQLCRESSALCFFLCSLAGGTKIDIDKDRSMNLKRVFLFAFSTLVATVCVYSPVWAQTTISTGSIQGTVTDPSGAVVAAANASITQASSGRVVTATTNSTGTYASGALTPGNYVVRIEAPNFESTELTLVVSVGVTTVGNATLRLGARTLVVEVAGSTVQVNTEQATVQGVIDTTQIENLPINGRNFLDLAQLEPGVQIQDGGNFDPTKKGFSSISFGGRFGRTARIEVDGVDISDETVGTTTQDIPESAIQEFQIGQSSLDLSTELTSSGSVNVTTRSGTNSYHGQAYYYFRDQSLDADLPGGNHSYFQRNQFGGNFGGPVIKDRLFFFADGERTK